MIQFKECLSLKEQFYNKKHLEAELNSKINNGLLKGLNPNNLTYVVLDGDKETADIYQGNYGDLTPEIKKKLVQAAKYFLTDLGCKLGKEQTKDGDPDILEIPILSYPRYEPQEGQWDSVTNPEAKRRLLDGRAIDVADLGIEVKPGVWKLNKFIDSTDYYDSKNNLWIWSIGKDKESGEMFAAVDGRFYNPKKEDFEYETIWLR